MKPLIVLLAVFFLSLFTLRFLGKNYEPAQAARIAMAAMLFFTSIGHFVFADGMSAMLPSSVPWRKGLILITGLLEAAAGIGLLFPAYQRMTGWWLIAFFLLVLPANISAAMRKIDYQGKENGPGMRYLWFRIPLQVFFIIWVYLSSVLYSGV